MEAATVSAGLDTKSSRDGYHDEVMGVLASHRGSRDLQRFPQFVLTAHIMCNLRVDTHKKVEALDLADEDISKCISGRRWIYNAGRI